MIRHGERQPCDYLIGERPAPNIYTHPKTVGSKEHTAWRGLELFEQTTPWSAAALQKKVHFLVCEKFPHLIGHLLHTAIICKKNKGASLCFLDKMRDPMFECFLVTWVSRVGHFLYDEHFHLRAEIERTPEQQWLGFVCPDALSDISKIRTADGKRCARHHAGAAFTKNHAPQLRRDVD